MAVINGLVTLAEWKNYKTAPGQTFTTDATDDAVIEDLIEGASRYFEGECAGRTFYPRVETRSYDVPENNWLFVDDDLLAVTTLTNGDDAAIASTEYTTRPHNYSPKYAIVIRDSSDTIWEWDSNSSSEAVIDVLGYWGYHDQYTLRAWKAGGTLNEATNLNASDLTFTMTAGHSVVAGNVIRCESELMIVTGVSTNDITVNKRGDNGSTAATHADGTAVTIWQAMDDVRQAVLEISRNSYSRRYGVNETGAAIVSPGGVVVGPADVSEFAARTIRRLRRTV